MKQSVEVTTAGARELRQFGLTVGPAIGIMFGLLLPWLWSGRYPLWPWLIACGLAATGLFKPALLGLPYRVWMRLAAALGWLNTRILLGLVFYVIMVPFGLIMRLAGKDPLAQRFDRNAVSYRVAAKRRPNHSHFERPF
jgi:hypothetical protein